MNKRDSELLILIMIFIFSLTTACNAANVQKTTANPKENLTNVTANNKRSENLNQIIDSNDDINWKVRQIEILGIKMLLPSDFTGDITSWQPRAQVTEYSFEKAEPNVFQIDVNIIVSQVDETKAKKAYQKLSPYQKLEFVFSHNRGNDLHKKAIDYNKNGIKGFLSKEEQSNGKYRLEWVTFRYFDIQDTDTDIFKNELQTFKLEITGSQDSLPQMMKIIDSLRFTGKRDDFLVVNR